MILEITKEERDSFDVLLWTGQKHCFTFDKVFVPNASQEDIFVEISQLVQSALDGYKVLIYSLSAHFHILSNKLIKLQNNNKNNNNAMFHCIFLD